MGKAGLPGDLRLYDLKHTTVPAREGRGAPQGRTAAPGTQLIQVTLDTYGHLFPDEQDRLADELDAAYETAQADLPWPIDGPLALAPSPG